MTYVSDTTTNINPYIMSSKNRYLVLKISSSKHKYFVTLHTLKSLMEIKY